MFSDLRAKLTILLLTNNTKILLSCLFVVKPVNYTELRNFLLFVFYLTAIAFLQLGASLTKHSLFCLRLRSLFDYTVFHKKNLFIAFSHNLLK